MSSEEHSGLRSCRWNVVSVTLSIVPILISYLIITYESRAHTWDPKSQFARTLILTSAWCILLSLALAIVTLFKDSKTWSKLMALALSLIAGFVLCAQV